MAWEASLETLGLWEASRERHDAAIKYLEEALADKPENPGLTVELLVNLAYSHEKLGEAQKAADLLREAMRLWESMGNRPHPAILASLAKSQEDLGHLDEAFAGMQRALALVREGGGNAQYEWQIGGGLAHVERAMGRQQDALAQYQEEIHAIELLRASALNTESGRAAALSARRSIYADTADLLCDMQQPAEALEVAERGRARAFLDMLAMSRSGLPDELTPEQRQEEGAKLTRISTLQKGLWKENLSPDEEKKIKGELTSAESDLDALHLEIRHSNPRYGSIHYPEPIGVSEIQNRLLDEHTALVEYLLGEKRSLAWVVTKSELTTALLPARKDIEEQVAAYRKALTERASTLTLPRSLKEIKRLGGKLYISLFQPIEPAVASKRTLIVVPDGTLNYLPFEALVASAGGNYGESQPSYVTEKFAIVYGPSASALVTVQKLNPATVCLPKLLLAFGDPVVASSANRGAAPPREAGGSAEATKEPSLVEDYAERGFSLTRLPYTREEVIALGRLFPGSKRDLYLGEAASEEAVKAAKLGDFRYIHFASHGFIDEAKPDRSGILLSRGPQSAEDGVLQMGEIMRLKMNAELVTLSACSTGLGKLVSGEGILGLTRAFFYAGARNVTVSLWDVNDSATSVLMKAFYQNLNRGLPKREALRQAKLSLLHSRNATWRYPYFWAPFVLVGEGN